MESNSREQEKRPITLFVAISVVVANMIGTGVFSTLSYQVLSIDSVFSIMMLWLVGGVVALCGALAYSELAAAMPRSGGEYHFLSKIYHPSVGFLSGWVSMIVGFSAPIAAAAIALSEYSVKIYPNLYPKVIAAVVVIGLSVIHGVDVRKGGLFQGVFTTLKILLLIFLVGAGFFVADGQDISILPTDGDWKTIFGTSAFAVSLVYVSYAYSGWNASSYIAGEVQNPKKNLPRSLIIGTGLVTLLYLGVNYVFLYTVPMDEMTNLSFMDLESDPELAVGFLAGKNIFGESGGKVISALIAFGLISTVSSMVIAGPRVMSAMGEDFRLFKRLSQKSSGGAPLYAIGLQLIIALVLIFTSSFEQVISYIGFTLSLFATLTVAGVYIMRIRKPDMPRPYKTWGYPVTPAIFLIINIWMMVYLIIQKPVISLAGLGTVAIGLVIYFIAAPGHQARTEDEETKQS